MARPPTPVLPESIGPYAIRGLLGQGGMGVVYDAVDPHRRAVALKILRSPGQDGHRAKTLYARFEREARILRELDHPGVVKLYDWGRADGLLFLAMEKVEGISLLTLRRRQALELEPLVELASRLALALDHVHAAGVVHRDIKPANVLVRPDGRPVLTDFGISGMADATGITRQGDLLGSPGFMAPEVVRGRPHTPAADQFALGRLLFELGARGPAPRLPRDAPLLEVLERALEMDWRRFPIGPGWSEVRPILQRMLEAPPDRRYPSMRTVAEAFGAVFSLPGPETLVAELARLAPDAPTTADTVDPDRLLDDAPAGGVPPDAPAPDGGAPVWPPAPNGGPSARPPAADGGAPPGPLEPSGPLEPPGALEPSGLLEPPGPLRPGTPTAAAAPVESRPRLRLPPLGRPSAGAPPSHAPPADPGPATEATPMPPLPAESGTTELAAPTDPAEPPQSPAGHRRIQPRTERRSSSGEEGAERFQEADESDAAGGSGRSRPSFGAGPGFSDGLPVPSRRRSPTGQPALRPSPLTPIASTEPEGRQAQLQAQIDRLRGENDALRMARTAPAPARWPRVVAAGALGLLAGVVATTWTAPTAPPPPLDLLLLPEGPPAAAFAPDLSGVDAPSARELEDARNLLAFAREKLAARDLASAEVMLGQCIDLAQLPACHRLRAGLRSILQDPSAWDSLRRYVHFAPRSEETARVRAFLDGQ